MLAEGAYVAAVRRRLDVSEQTYYRWRDQFGGLKAQDAERLKELESENTKLAKLLAEAELAKSALKELADGTSRPGRASGNRKVVDGQTEAQ